MLEAKRRKKLHKYADNLDGWMLAMVVAFLDEMMKEAKI